MPTYEYHSRLRELVEDRSWNGRFRSSSPSGPREYPLDDRCAADFCYDLPPAGRLFIEDDDPSRALSNLIKYWPWCTARPTIKVVYLVHIIGDRGHSVHLKQCDFVAEKMREDLSRIGIRFEYRQLRIAGSVEWHEPHKWLPKVRAVLEDVARDEAPQDSSRS